MPIELVGDQKEIRVWQYHQLQDFIAGLAKEAAGKRSPLQVNDLEGLRAWQAANRPLIERALGWPAPIPEYEPQLISDEEIGSDELVRSIRRMTIRVAEGLDVYGILLLPHRENPKLMLCFHGGIGCPELVTSVCDSTNYNDGARRFVELGYAVFAPLFVLRREEEIEPDWPADYRVALHMNALWAGTTVLAIELAKAERALKFFDTYPGVDASEAGVAGLSYGGYFALYAAALIPRITFSVSSCYFNDRLEFLVTKPASILDWKYPGAGALFTDVEIAALICPRPLYIEAGQRDELMDVEGAKREAEKVRAIYEACGAGKEFFFDPFDGVHEFNLSHIGEFFRGRL